MIVAYTGKLGSGKTYTMTKDIVKALNRGTRVYSNYKIYWNGYQETKRFWKTALIWLRLRRPYRNYPATNLTYWSEVEEILDLDNGIVAIDEGSVYLNSRNWALLDPEFQRKILQSRKDGLHIYFSAQRIGQIDITLRNLVNRFYVCTFKNFLGFKCFVLGEYEIDNNGDINEEDRLSIRFVPLNTKLRLYDTNEKISSMISTMANYGKQFSQREAKLRTIKKYKDKIDNKLAQQGFDTTVDEVLSLDEQGEEVLPPSFVTEEKVVHNSVIKPVDKPKVVRLQVRAA